MWITLHFSAVSDRIRYAQVLFYTLTGPKLFANRLISKYVYIDEPLHFTYKCRLSPTAKSSSEFANTRQAKKFEIKKKIYKECNAQAVRAMRMCKSRFDAIARRSPFTIYPQRSGVSYLDWAYRFSTPFQTFFLFSAKTKIASFQIQ